MRGRNWVPVVGVGLLMLGTLGCAVFVARGLWIDAYATAAGLSALAAGLAILLVTFSARTAALENKNARQSHSLHAMSEHIEVQANQLMGLEERLDRESARLKEVVFEVRDLRRSVHNMQEWLEQIAPAETPRYKPAGDQLELLLEPMIDIALGKTAHYRAQLHMMNETVGEVGHADLMAKAGQGGIRAPLDLHMLRKVIPVLQRLRAKHPARSIFIPLGTTTLNSKDDLDAILRLVEASSGVAGGIVFEIAHAQLAALAGDGIEGLAKLGRLGAHMALSHVTIAGLDLASLRQLGVRYLSVEGGAIDAGFGIAPTWFEFAEFARSMQFDIIAGGVVTATHAAAAAEIAQFGHGSFYAPPRRLRTPGASATVYQRSQAA